MHNAVFSSWNRWCNQRAITVTLHYPGTDGAISQQAQSPCTNSTRFVIQVPGGDDDKLQRGEKQGEYGDVDDEDLEKANQGQQDANKQRVEQQRSDKKATTSLPGKSEKKGERSAVADDNRKKEVSATAQCVLCHTVSVPLFLSHYLCHTLFVRS